MYNVNDSIYQKINENIDNLAKDIFTFQTSESKRNLINADRLSNDEIIRNIKQQLSYFSVCISLPSISLFSDYVSWLKILVEAKDTRKPYPTIYFHAMKEAFAKLLSNEENMIVSEFLQKGFDVLKKPTPALNSFIDSKSALSLMTKQFIDLLLEGDKSKANNLILKAISEQGIPVEDLYLDVFQVALYEVGRLWQLGKINVAQEHYCSACIELIMSTLYPKFISNKKNNYSFMGVNICNEYHSIGLRMVSNFLEKSGWNSFYFGANTPSSSILEMLTKYDINVLGISVTMAFNLPHLKDLISILRSSDKYRNVKVMVGGYPFNIDAELWKLLGADGFSVDANQAVKVANHLICNHK